MNPIAFNIHISNHLRTKYQFTLALLPMGLMFASFGPLYFLSEVLSVIFGIPPDVPVKDQPNGFLWLVAFLVVMFILMITGYLLGWLLNAAIFHILLGWPKEKIRRVFLYSEVPTNWKVEDAKPSNTASAKSNDSGWASIRQKGKWHFILNRGVLTWGIPMYAIMTILPVLSKKVEATAPYLLWQAVVWGAAGSLFGLVIWFFSEKQFKKQNGAKKP